jgi:type I restriction enzyme M protein
MGVVVPHGVLFRGGREGAIREALVRENLLDAVVGLADKLFYGTGIPAALLLFRQGRTTEDVLFVDASGLYEAGTRQNRLGDDDIERVAAAVEAFRADPDGYADEPKVTHRATFEEVEANEFNLNVSRYVDTFEPEAEVDLAAAQREIRTLERELAGVRAEMDAALAALGLALPDADA